MCRTHALLLSINVALSSSAFAIDGIGGMFGFFGGQDIDYWQEGKVVHDGLAVIATATPAPKGTDRTQGVASVPASEKTPTAFSGSTLVREADAKPFSWDKYKNVQTAEFWDDGGDWIPPRPFREAAANPSENNINEYLEWQIRKTLVVNRFQAALVSANAKKQSNKKENSHEIKQVPFAWRSLRIAYFYQSSCGHCRTSAPVVEMAQSLGAQVTFVQLDAKENPPLHAKSIPYSAAWVKVFPITSTPTWVLKVGNATGTVTGSLNLEELASKASQLTKQGKDK